jgi:hypothetical protein
MNLNNNKYLFKKFKKSRRKIFLKYNNVISKFVLPEKAENLKNNDIVGFYNLSHEIFTNTEIKALSKGLKFIPIPKPFKLDELELSISNLIRNIRLKYHFSDSSNSKPKLLWKNSKFEPPRSGSFVESYLSDTAISLRKAFQEAVGLNMSSFTKEEKFQNRILINTLFNLKKKSHLIYKVADKNLGLVVLTKDKYKDMVMNQLVINPGSSTYERLEECPDLYSIYNNLKIVLSKYGYLYSSQMF